MKKLKIEVAALLIFALAGCAPRSITMGDLAGCYKYGGATIRIQAASANYGNNSSAVYLERGRPSLLFLSPGVILALKGPVEEFRKSGKKQSFQLVTKGFFSTYMSFFTDSEKAISIKRSTC